MPYSMGSLYWQFNDPWPGFSWSSRDYYGQWKALHFRAKNLYKNVQLYIESGINNINDVKVHITNDYIEE